jgi:hypothetical protein
LIDLKIVLLVLAAHWFCDFVLQSDEMALNKSTSWFWLTMHVKTYSLGMLIFSFFIFGYHNMIAAWGWVWANAVLHWTTDAVTSRINSHLWKQERKHWFFVMVGFDQLIHYTCLFVSLTYVQDLL